MNTTVPYASSAIRHNHRRKSKSSYGQHENMSSAFTSSLSCDASPFPDRSGSYAAAVAAAGVAENGTMDESDFLGVEEEVEYYASVGAAPLPGLSLEDDELARGGVRYVNVRVAVPAESPSILPLDYSNPLLSPSPSNRYDYGSPTMAMAESPMTVSSNNTSSCFSPIPSSPFLKNTIITSQLRSQSPYGFVPISRAPNSNRQQLISRSTPSPPPSSPHYYNKATAARDSPSVWTAVTETTAADTPSSTSTAGSVTTFDTIRASPATTFHSFVAPLPLYQQQSPSVHSSAQRRQQLQGGGAGRVSPHLSPAPLKEAAPKGKKALVSCAGRDSPRPKTQSPSITTAITTGRKSPFPPLGTSRKSPHHDHPSSPSPAAPAAATAASSFEEDLIRKTRMKTELCMHYKNGRPCPFGASCTYAHGEEELQMTKLLDLQNAGLVDVETFRTRPCFTWTATGSW